MASEALKQSSHSHIKFMHIPIQVGFRCTLLLILNRIKNQKQTPKNSPRALEHFNVFCLETRHKKYIPFLEVYQIFYKERTILCLY